MRLDVSETSAFHSLYEPDRLIIVSRLLLLAATGWIFHKVPCAL